MTPRGRAACALQARPRRSIRRKGEIMADYGLTRGRLARVDLVTDADGADVGSLSEEFPTVTFAPAAHGGATDAFVIDDVAWQGAFELRPFDVAAESAAIAVRGDAAVTVAGQVLTRYQRFLYRTNRWSAATFFPELVRGYAYASGAERDRALDTWQWTLRLDPEASLAMQVAAFLHAVEREDETDAIRPHRAPAAVDPDRGARALERARHANIEEEVARAAADVVAGAAEARLSAMLFAADALSFLSLESDRYVDHFGVAQARRKTAFLFKHLAPRAQKKLAFVRLRPDVDRLFRQHA
jgi:hypothetical protein